MPTNQQVLFELVNKRTRNAKHFALADGTFQAVISSADVHFQDESGNWFNINTDLNDEADFDSWDLPVNRHGKVHFENAQGKSRADKKANKLNRDNYDYQALQVPYYAKIPRNFKRGYSVGVDDTLLAFVPVGASPSKGYIDTDKTNAIKYQDVWNDADVELEVLVSGLKETITIKTDRAPSSFSFQVTGPLADDLTAGTLSLAPAWLVDAQGSRRDVSQTVRRDSSGKVYVDMVADVTGLTYPITIDPTVTLAGSTDTGDTYVASANPTTAYYTQTYMDAGYGQNGSGNIERLLVQFTLTGANIPSGAVVSSANLNLTVTGEYGGQSGSMYTMYLDAYRITSSWTNPGASWNSQPTYAPARTSQVHTGGGKSAGSVDSWDVKNDVQSFLNGTYQNYGWMIRDTSESGTNLGSMTYASKEYTNYASYVPNLTINYTLPPTAPTVTSPNGGETWNAQQTITWTSATDPLDPTTSVQANPTTGGYDSLSLKPIQTFKVPANNTGVKYVDIYVGSASAQAVTVSLVACDSSGTPDPNTVLKSVNTNLPSGNASFRATFDDPTILFNSGQYVGVMVYCSNGGPSISSSGTDTYTDGSGWKMVSGTLTKQNYDYNVTLQWGSSNPALQYEIQLSTDNGTTWADIVALTSAGATSYTYDFSSQSQSPTCLIRIRAYDGASYGPWDQSNGVFTIQHNQAPLAPTNLSPAGGTGLDRASVIRLSWQKNDPDGTSDPQSKFDLQYSIDDGTTWTTVTQTTTNQYYDVPATTFPHGNVLWKVRTYDQSGVSGPYSAQATFLAGDKPAAPTITSPINNGTVGVSRPTIQWSSPDQAHYEAQVLKSADSSSLWDSGDVTSTNKAVTVGNDIANGTAIVVEVRVKNSDGIWSDWASVNVTISYTPPAISTVAATSQDAVGYVQILITNPAPSGSQPDVAYNDIHRSPSGLDTWTRIATNVPQNATFQDYSAPSGQAHDYKVTAVGNNGTSSDSAVHTITPSLKGAWISLASDPEGTVHRFKYDGEGRSADHNLTATMMAFEGRTLPVADVADQETQDIKITVKCRNGTDDLAALRTLLSSKQTVLYRDGRGRKIYGFISALPEQDTQFGTDVDLTIQAVDYQEAV